MGVPDPLQEAVEMLRRRGFDVTIIAENRITVAGHVDEKQIKIDDVRGGWKVTYETGNDSFATVVSRADDARQTAADWTAGQFGVTHGRYDDLPAELQECVDELLRRDFGVVFGKDGNGGVAFHAGRSGEITIAVEDWGQTWGVTMQGDDRPDVEECWDRPGRVAAEVERWFDDFED